MDKQPVLKNNEPEIWQKFKDRAEALRKSSMKIHKISETEKNTIFKTRAHELSLEKGGTKEETNILNLITFSVSDELFGIEVKYLQEVYEVKKITKIPCTPPLFSGLINYRGDVLSIVNLQVLFDSGSNFESAALNPEPQQNAPQEKQKILIVAHGGNKLGVVIEKLDNLLELPPEIIRPVSSFFYEKNKIIKHEVKINGLPLLIIDPGELLSDKRLYINEGVS